MPFAHDHASIGDFAGAVEAIRPSGIIGVSGMPRTFTKPVVEAVARMNRRPIVFALSNPTSKSECTAEEAYTWSEGPKTLAAMVSEEDRATGRIYPGLDRIREVSSAIAVAVAEVVFRRGLTKMTRPADLDRHVKSQMFHPTYVEYI
ncbi:MAG: mae, partial [Deltaproteobacteria bacterium]|nr:mae [Deltaproteobacteria bacterium]